MRSRVMPVACMTRSMEQPHCLLVAQTSFLCLAAELPGVDGHSPRLLSLPTRERDGLPHSGDAHERRAPATMGRLTARVVPPQVGTYAPLRPTPPATTIITSSGAAAARTTCA